MTESLAEEIRTLQSLVWSERDPEGRGFASLADAHRRAGEPRKAFEILSDGLVRLPSFASGHVVAARLYVEQGLLAEGELASRRALELDPDNVSAMASLVRALERAGRSDEAAAVRAALAALEPEVLVEEGLEAADDDVLDISALEPEAALDDEEDVLDVASLEPSLAEEVLDVASLEPSLDEEVLDVASLGPEPEEDLVLDVRTLAPHAEPDPVRLEAELPEEELVLGVGALAPDADEAPDVPDQELVLDVSALEPDLPDEEPLLDLAALAPNFESALEPDLPEEELVLEGAALESALPDPALATRDVTAPSGGAPRIYTRTLGELYAKQGFTDRAAEIFRQLIAENPDDPALAARLDELERTTAPIAGPAPAAETQPRPQRDEELEAIARDLTMNRDVHPDVDSPFAWAAEDDEEDSGIVDPGPNVREYFGDLLSWRSGREA